MSEKTVVRLGRIKIESRSVVVSDPCYLKERGKDVADNNSRGLAATVSVVPGEYVCTVELSDEGSWGERVSELRIMLDGAREYRRFRHNSDMAVDSGQMMMADLDRVLAEWGDPDYDHGKFEDLCKAHAGKLDYLGACHATCDRDNHGGTLDGAAVVSSTGYGDGCYPLYEIRNAEGHNVGLAVAFLEEGEEDGW